MSKDQMIEKIIDSADDKARLRLMLEALYSLGKFDAISEFMDKVAKS